jgi:hypothetical protein
MPNSARFTSLEQRLGDLRTNLLPLNFDPTGVYTSQQLDNARGYRVLVHAEVEAFLEEIARAAVVTKLNDWTTSKRISGVLFCVLAAAIHGFVDDVENPSITPVSIRPSRTDSDTIDDTVTAAVQKYQGRITSNNGVKVKNLKILFLPLGVNFSELDTIWLNNMDSFGRMRGDVAHQSIGASHLINPQDELNSVNGLLVGLNALDQKIEALMLL